MERLNQTTPWLDKDIVVSFLMPVTLALQLGTGGYETREYYQQRLLDTVPTYYGRADSGLPVSVSRNNASDVRHVLDVLKPSVTGLARYLGVSRTTIYDWKHGKQVGADNAAKLASFSRAADVIADANLQMSPLVRGRKLPGGMTLFESIASGADAEQAALALVTMLREEAARRDRLTARFLGRIKPDTEGTHDAPTVFNE